MVSILPAPLPDNPICAISNGVGKFEKILCGVFCGVVCSIQEVQSN